MSMKTEPIEILVIDDNEDDIIMIKEAMSEAKLINLVNRVHDGEQALAYLRKQGEYADANTPALILLDINMPRKNGFEVLEEIKADPQLRSLPVVMLTTSAREEDIVRSYASGACSFISKPVDFDKFQEIARQFSLYWALVAKVPQRV